MISQKSSLRKILCSLFSRLINYNLLIDLLITLENARL